MRRLYKILAGISFLAFAAVSQAQQGYSGRFFYDSARKDVSAVTAYKLTTFDFPKFSLDLEAFGGASLKDGSLVGGFDIGHTWSLAKNLDTFLGIGFAVKQGEALPSSFGLMGGVTVRF